MGKLWLQKVVAFWSCRYLCQRGLASDKWTVEWFNIQVKFHCKVSIFVSTHLWRPPRDDIRDPMDTSGKVGKGHIKVCRKRYQSVQIEETCYHQARIGFGNNKKSSQKITVPNAAQVCSFVYIQYWVRTKLPHCSKPIVGSLGGKWGSGLHLESTLDSSFVLVS